MAPWLTFVVGIILGLVIGWLIDMLYRRAPRPEPDAAADRMPEWAQPLPAATPASELPGVAAASAVAVAAATDDDGLDVPPDSETAAATEEVNWKAISERVDEAAAAAPPAASSVPRIVSELPDEGLPPDAADTLAPPTK